MEEYKIDKDVWHEVKRPGSNKRAALGAYCAHAACCVGSSRKVEKQLHTLKEKQARTVDVVLNLGLSLPSQCGDRLPSPHQGWADEARC